VVRIALCRIPLLQPLFALFFHLVNLIPELFLTPPLVVLKHLYKLQVTPFLLCLAVLQMMAEVSPITYGNNPVFARLPSTVHQVFDIVQFLVMPTTDGVDNQ
jgi:hypothetical protein